MVKPLNQASGNTGASGKTPKIDTSKLNSEQQQLVKDTLGVLQQDEFASKMLSNIAERNTPVTFDNNGLKGGQAAGTQISGNGDSKITLGTQAIDKAKDKEGKMKAIAGMLGNEFHSAISVGDMAKNGKGTKNSATKSQELGSFFTDGYWQSIIEKKSGTTGDASGSGKSNVTAKDATRQLEKEYGTSVDQVIHKAGSYAKLPDGDVSSSGLDELAKNQSLPEDFVKESKEELTRILGNGGSSPKTASKGGKVSKVAVDEVKGDMDGKKADSSVKNPSTTNAPDGEKLGDLTLKD